MANVAEKSGVQKWETVATYVATFPSDDGEGACDVEVQVGSVTIYDVLVNGHVEGTHADRDDAQAQADGQNAEVEEECGELGSDGAASVCEREVWFVRTQDDAGGSDEADDTEYATREEAVSAAEGIAWENDEGLGMPGDEDAEGYLRRRDEAAAGQPDPEGKWCVYWETSLDDAGPRTRYATEEQANAAAKIANEELHKRNPGGNLLCGFSVRALVEGEWVADREPSEDEAHGYTFAGWLAAAGRSDSASERDLRAAWRAGEDPAEYAEEDETTKTFTYTIFDADPNQSGGTEWPTHSNLELEADSDDEAIEAVRDVMSTEAAGLNTSDGYDVGDKLHALIWDAAGTIIGTPTYELTAEDLGVEDNSDLIRSIEELTFHTPPECAGQVVEVSFACDADHIYKRIYDRSDHSETIVVYEHPEEECDFDPWNTYPNTGEKVREVELKS